MNVNKQAAEVQRLLNRLDAGTLAKAAAARVDEANKRFDEANKMATAAKRIDAGMLAKVVETATARFDEARNMAMLTSAVKQLEASNKLATVASAAARLDTSKLTKAASVLDTALRQKSAESPVYWLHDSPPNKDAQIAVLKSELKSSMARDKLEKESDRAQIERLEATVEMLKSGQPDQQFGGGWLLD